MLEIIATLLAGLGLYFIGVGGIRSSLQQIPGRRLRGFLGQATKHPIRAAASGFLAGSVTQTSIGVSVILAGLIARGFMTVTQALPVIAWSNLGLVVLVFLNNLPVAVIAMLLIGLGGIASNFGLGGRLKGVMSPLFSLGLVLYGLKLMKLSLQNLSAMPGFDHFMDPISGANLWPFLLGAVLRIPIQSTSAVALIGITLNGAGVFTESQAMMVFYGTALGTGLGAYFLTSHFQGVMRQVTLFEAMINGLAGITLLALFYIEQWTGLPLIQHGLQALAHQVDDRLALGFLLQQLLCVLFAYLTLGKALGWLAKWAPITVEQDLSKPRFIHDEALQDIQTGLSLAEREISHLLERMPDYLTGVREESKGLKHHPSETYHVASLAVLQEVNSFLADMSAKPMSHASSHVLLNLKHRLDMVGSIDDAVFQIVQQLKQMPASNSVQTLTHNVAESLDALLHTALDAMGGDVMDVEMLRLLTLSPGEVAERLRQDYLHTGKQLEHQERSCVLTVTTQHERIMWTLNQFSQTLQTSPSQPD